MYKGLSHGFSSWKDKKNGIMFKSWWIRVMVVLNRVGVGGVLGLSGF